MNVSVELPEPPLIVFVPNAAVTPAGSVDVVSVTAELNDPTGETVMVELPALPCATVNDDGEAETLKPEVCVPPVSALIKLRFAAPSCTLSNSVTGWRSCPGATGDVEIRRAARGHVLRVDEAMKPIDGWLFSASC